MITARRGEANTARAITSSATPATNPKLIPEKVPYMSGLLRLSGGDLGGLRGDGSIRCRWPIALRGVLLRLGRVDLVGPVR